MPETVTAPPKPKHRAFMIGDRVRAGVHIAEVIEYHGHTEALVRYHPSAAVHERMSAWRRTSDLELVEPTTSNALDVGEMDPLIEGSHRKFLAGDVVAVDSNPWRYAIAQTGPTLSRIVVEGVSADVRLSGVFENLRLTLVRSVLDPRNVA